MRAALGLARRSLGETWPNPSVGCVLVKDGHVVGRGFTARGGRPHAETIALDQAGAAARGSSAYVTLEPCCHKGQTGPCAEALIQAGVARVVAAIEDPDPRVSGRGLEMLKKAGIAVELGLCAESAAELNAGFFQRILHERPLITLKLATSLDGRIATHSRHSHWITGETARAASHRLRAETDAILVGIGTALADDPELTCRLPGLEHRSPVRVVVDSRLRLPLTAKLVAGARSVPTWLLTRLGNDPDRLNAYEACGVSVIETAAGANGRVDLKAAMSELGRRGLTRVLVEGGAHVAAGFFQEGLVDRLAWFRAPTMIGGDGIPAAVAFGIDRLDQAPRFRRLTLTEWGADLFEYLTLDL